MEISDIDTAEITYGDTSLCYQCAKCSSGCPVAEEMDMYPHQIIHLVSLGLEERVLDTKTIWICANCYACSVKCPNDINITGTMNKLKELAIAQGVKPKTPEVYKFHKVFANDVFRRGRAHELRIMGEYNLRSKNPFKNITLAPKMFFKNKLKIMPPKSVKGFRKWVKGLINKKR
jgi:heterodisulfide reductase subunit C